MFSGVGHGEVAGGLIDAEARRKHQTLGVGGSVSSVAERDELFEIADGRLEPKALDLVVPLIENENLAGLLVHDDVPGQCEMIRLGKGGLLEQHVNRVARRVEDGV